MNDRKAKMLQRIAAAALILSLIAGSLSGCGPASVPPADNNANTVPQGNSNAAPSGNSNAVPSNSGNTAPSQTYKSSKETAALLSEAEIYYYGIGTPADHAKAKEIYKSAMAKGSPLAVHMLAMLTLMDDTSTDLEKTMEEYEKLEDLAILGAKDAADNGDPEACITMGMIAINTSQPKDGVPYLETAAKAEEPYATMAMTALGEIYEKARSSEDYALAAQWYEKAANAGSKRAIQLLAQLYYLSINDQAKAVEWWKKALDAGYNSWYSLAQSYTLLKDYGSAAEAYEKGIEAGNYTCSYGLGNLYYAGAGVEKSFTKALECYAGYFKARPSHEGRNYTDLNEKRIRENIDNMMKSGAVDKNTVLSIMGSDFLDK